jgi:cyclophilin family peptidyl-prolyl cis-trans isomerase
MSPFRKFFDACSRSFGSRDAAASGRRGSSGRRRRQRPRAARLDGCEQLEPKQVMAANLWAAIDDIQIADGAARTINLASHFEESAVTGTVVKFQTNAPLANPDFFVEVFDQSGEGRTRTTPLTATNFLTYVNDGSYDNTILHRAVDSFVIQGGGYTAPDRAANLPESNPGLVTQRATVTNEPGNLNTRGTVALAKIANQPNSGSNQFYFNLGNNSNLNTDNGGYTVFGRVLGAGMTVVDTMANALTYDATAYYGNGALSDLPLWNVNSDNIVQPNDFVKFTDVSTVAESALLSFTVTSSDTSKLAASIVKDQLLLAPVPGQTGTVNVTVRGTSKLDNSTVEDTIVLVLNSVSSSFTTVESVGSVQLRSNDTTGELLAGDTVIKVGDRPVTLTRWSGRSYVGAEAVGGVNTVLVAFDAGGYKVWEFNNAWNHVASKDLPTTAADIYALETAFNRNLDGDEHIGTPPIVVTFTTVESVGSVQLRSNDTTGELLAGDTVIKVGDRPVTLTRWSGRSYVGAEAVGGVNTVLVALSAGGYKVWEFDNAWNHQASKDLPPAAADIYALETAFDRDLNGDFETGTPIFTNVVETLGAVRLASSPESGVFAANGITVYIGKNPLTVTRWMDRSYVGAEVVGGVNTILVRLNAGGYKVWEFDNAWIHRASKDLPAVGSTQWTDLEAAFGIDLDAAASSAS